MVTGIHNRHLWQCFGSGLFSAKPRNHKFITENLELKDSYNVLKHFLGVSAKVYDINFLMVI